MTVLVFGFLATHANARCVTEQPSSLINVHSAGPQWERDSDWIRTCLCKLCELLDLADLGATLLFIQTLERVLEEIRVRRKTRVFWNAVVVLNKIV